MNQEQLQASKLAALEGLTGRARKDAARVWQEANKGALHAAAEAAELARRAPERFVTDAAAVKGLVAHVVANIGLVKGSSRESVVKVTGDTFSCKDALKAHGAIWNGAHKCWVFADEDQFFAALSAI